MDCKGSVSFALLTSTTSGSVSALGLHGGFKRSHEHELSAGTSHIKTQVQDYHWRFLWTSSY